MMMTTVDDFRECEACATKPGTPALCDSCLHNRAMINRLQRERRLWVTHLAVFAPDLARQLVTRWKSCIPSTINEAMAELNREVNKNDRPD